MATLFLISKHFCSHVVPGVSQLFHAHVLPRLRAFSILYLSIVLGLAYLAMIFFSYRRFQALKDQYKWLRLEWKFFNALIKDVKYVSDLGKKVDERAHQLWDSQLRPGAIVQLSDVEKEWVRSIETSVGKAKRRCDTYESLSRRRQFLRWVYSVLMDFRKFRPLENEIEAINDDLVDHLFSKCRKIYGALEWSRSNVRSLQDRPIVEKYPYYYNRAVPPTHSVEEKLKDLINGKPDVVSDSKEDIRYRIEFPVKLLLAFLEDLYGLRMETKTEKAWVELVEETILELQQDLDGIIQIANRMNWIFYIGNWIARRKLKKKYRLYAGMLSALIMHKSVCDFKFIRRDVLKSVHRSPEQQKFPFQFQTTTDDDDISSLLNNFNNQLKQGSDMDEFTQLYKTFERLNKLLMDSKAVEGIKHSRMAWTDQLKIIIKDAEKSLKSYGESSRSEWGENQNKTEPQSKSKEIGRFNMGLRLLGRCIMMLRTEPGEERNSVVGMDEDVHEVISRLITNSENCSTHFIVGMRGIGKTTLAQWVYQHTTIQNHFKFRYWVSLTDHGDEEKNALRKKLGQELMHPSVTNKEKEEGTYKEENDIEEETNREAKEKDYSFKEINDFLKAKKYLIVLDNISSVETLKSLKAAFPESTNGSRIVITTRHKSVASNDENSKQLRLRTKDESLSLFQQMVHLPSDTSDQPELSEAEAQKVNTLARKVVGRCGGLPLSILRLGYLLSGMKNVTYEQLSRVLEHIDHNQTPWSEIVEFNEKDLAPHLKKCLSYFGLFPRDSETSTRRLVALWVAEGLVQQTAAEQEPLESVAKRYLDELISRNLIQEVERKPNGKVKTCGFPSALRDLWLRKFPISTLDGRLNYNTDENDACSTSSRGSSRNLQNLLRSCRNPRSILFFDTREGNKPGEEIGNFLSMGIASGHLLQLQVLDLEHVFRPNLPKNIGELVKLIYLGLRWTYLEEIPSSIGNLLDLQTLDVRHTDIRSLPKSVWKLKKLRHLWMNQIYRSHIKHQRGNSLQNLHTLRGAFIDNESLKAGLGKLTNLRKLELAFQLNLSEQTSLAKSLLELKKLQALKLKSIDEMSRPQDLKATFLSDLENLSNLYLFGKLEKTSINGLPQSLSDLTLSASRLSDDPMPELEKLRNLKCLSLYAGSYIGKSMSCSKGGFLRLQVLNFLMLKELEEWNVVEEAMPNLKKLEIRSCYSLKVPNGLRHLKTLGELKLKRMLVEFTSEIEETKEKIWADFAISPAIIIDEPLSMPNGA
ncbi:probable disease resistance RPP8-like protein 2 [Quercus lobata]|uniref:NB-ARC domain-containing protein n=1 Tax=Quercus lobata TaxID=97700 RepID=A0A7N2LLZ2_QUELO|nr:probable disease resistance RPP8-like protein 2 [Quercus lobata]